jgi:SAM-dependent methyltransferase
VCAARALRAAGWAAAAGPQLRRPAPAADAGPPGSDFTEAALLRDDDVSSACGGPDGDADADGSGGEKLAALRAAVAALPWRQASRTVTVCGVRLTVAQKPRDTRPRAGGAGETGLVLWGAATLLSWHLEHACARDCAGARILELGCGCGLTSVAAALLGADVTATDGDDEVVALAEANAADALRQAWRDTCGIAPPEGPPAAVRRLHNALFLYLCHKPSLPRLTLLFPYPAQDVLIFNRRPESTRRLCDLQPVTDLLAARGLTWQYAEVPKGACEQVAVLSQPRRFVITPHGAHEARAARTAARYGYVCATAAVG